MSRRISPLRALRRQSRQMRLLVVAASLSIFAALLFTGEPRTFAANVVTASGILENLTKLVGSLASLGTALTGLLSLLPFSAAAARETSPPSGAPPEATIATMGDLAAWGMPLSEAMDRMIDLDYGEMDPPPTPRFEGTQEQWTPLFEEHPETWRLLVSPAREIIGYVCFVPLLPPYYARARAGQLFDSEITSAMVPHLHVPGTHYVYFISICISRTHRGRGNKRLLFDALGEIALELKRNEIGFREICTNAFTAAGEALCAQLEMEPGPSHAERGRIYFRSFADLLRSPLFAKQKELRARYGVA